MSRLLKMIESLLISFAMIVGVISLFSFILNKTELTTSVEVVNINPEMIVSIPLGQLVCTTEAIYKELATHIILKEGTLAEQLIANSTEQQQIATSATEFSAMMSIRDGQVCFPNFYKDRTFKVLTVRFNYAISNNGKPIKYQYTILQPNSYPNASYNIPIVTEINNLLPLTEDKSQ